jgi:hypothetical protein
MATVYTIWSRKEKRQVPGPFTTYPTSADADAAVRRMIGKAGNTKDKQTEVFDVESHTV